MELSNNYEKNAGEEIYPSLFLPPVNAGTSERGARGAAEIAEPYVEQPPSLERPSPAMYEERSISLLAPGLAPYVDEARLAGNAARQLEQYPISHEDVAQIDHIKEHLLTVPLTHYVQKPETAAHIAAEGLHPHAALAPDLRGNTFALDKSLGLDAYTFSNLAESPSVEYGRVGILLDPSKVIEKSVVTDTDINHLTVGVGEGRLPFEGLDPRSQARIAEEYFGSMVTGQDWLDITSHKILSYLKEHGPDALIPLGMELDAGEIKHLGTIPPAAIQGVVDGTGAAGKQAAEAFEDSIIAKGFMPPDVATVLYLQRPEYHAPVLARTQAGHGVWRRVLGL